MQSQKAKDTVTDGNVPQHGGLWGKGRLCLMLQQLIDIQESSAFSSSFWLEEIQEATFVLVNL